MTICIYITVDHEAALLQDHRNQLVVLVLPDHRSLLSPQPPPTSDFTWVWSASTTGLLDAKLKFMIIPKIKEQIIQYIVCVYITVDHEAALLQDPAHHH